MFRGVLKSGFLSQEEEVEPMKEVVGVVENGRIKLPPVVHLPDGLAVRVVWDEQDEPATKPYDREGLTEEDVNAELQWATGKRFSG